MSEFERRANPDDKARDRRFVPRFSHPTIRDSIQQIRFWSLFTFWLLIAFIVGRLIQGFVISAEHLAKGAAQSVGAGIWAATLMAYAKSLKQYSESETPATLANVFEKQRNVWMAAGTLTIICIFGYLLFL